MIDTNTGGPAFPSGLIDPSTPEDAVQSLHNGMTLRDYFIANIQDENAGDGDYHHTIKEELVGRLRPIPEVDGWIAVLQFEADFRAAWRAMRADAMLIERSA